MTLEELIQKSSEIGFKVVNREYSIYFYGEQIFVAWVIDGKFKEGFMVIPGRLNRRTPIKSIERLFRKMEETQKRG